MLAANPYVTAKGASRQLAIAYTTAQRAVTKLEDLGVLTQIGERKLDRVYCARPLSEILEEPAALTPVEHC